MSAALLTCLVVGIADGDTLTARCEVEGKPQTIVVRIRQIDAPETSSKQPFGQAAKRHLSKLCFKQEASVKLSKKQTYGREVGDVACSGVDVSRSLVAAGLAWAYDGFAKDADLYDLQAAAREARRGLWSDTSPVPPWDWRRGVR